VSAYSSYAFRKRNLSRPIYSMHIPYTSLHHMYYYYHITV
jgi:hypothetical protein